MKEYDPERIIYVTDARQQLHFRQWFNIAGKMGYAVKLVHVPFGLMSYQGKAISTREGNLIKLDDLLAEAVRRAHEIVKDRGGDEKNHGYFIHFKPRCLFDYNIGYCRPVVNSELSEFPGQISMNSVSAPDSSSLTSGSPNGIYSNLLSISFLR